jgi:membrane protein YqaA with SNARE-associated domain
MLYYLTLLKISFLAATILPMGCEPYFIFLLSKGELDPILLVSYATLGNSIGSLTTFLMARYLPFSRVIKLFKINTNQLEKLESSFLRRGGFYAFWCWLPVIGDVLAFFYGYKRYSWSSFLIYMTMGKLFRFLVIYFCLF